MFIGQGKRFEIWDYLTWTKSREKWLEKETLTLPKDFEMLSLQKLGEMMVDFAFVIDRNFKAQELIEIISNIDRAPGGALETCIRLLPKKQCFRVTCISGSWEGPKTL